MCKPETLREHAEILVNEMILDDRFGKLAGPELTDRIIVLVMKLQEGNQ